MEGGHPHFRQSALDYTHSLRLTFAYSDNKIHLVRAERIAMIAPAAATPPPVSGQTGYWIEVRDKDGELLYHRPLHDPMREGVEVFGDEVGEPIYRVDNPKREGEFDVLVPDLPQAAQFSLHGPPPKARKPHGSSKELLKHDFDELRRLHAPRADQGEKADEEEPDEEEERES